MANQCRRYEKKAADLLWHGLTSDTRKVYRAGQTTYIKFAAHHGFAPAFPVTFEALAHFIATIAKQMSTETKKVYVSHLHSLHIDHGYNTDVFSDERIKHILRGASRMYGSKPKRKGWRS